MTPYSKQSGTKRLPLKRSRRPIAAPTQKHGISPTNIEFEWNSGMHA